MATFAGVLLLLCIGCDGERLCEVLARVATASEQLLSPEATRGASMELNEKGMRSYHIAMVMR